MKHIILCVFSAIAAFGQAQTPFRVYPSAGSLTGQLWLEERRTNPGQNVVKLEAPQSIAADFSLILPNADGAAGRCLQTDGSGALGWRVCGDTYDVTRYGALCDNSTDDTAAIQAAINAAQSAGGGTVAFPLGICKATTINVTANFIGFRGQGRSMSTLQATTAAALIAVSTSSADIYALEIRDMTLQGTGASTSYGIEVTGANNFYRSVFSNIYLAAFRKAVWIHNAGFGDWFSFRNNFCDNSTVTSGTCLDLETGLTSPGGVIEGNQFIGGTNGTAIYYHGDFGDIVVGNNHSEAGGYFLNADCSTGCTYGERLVVTGNKIDNATIAPIRINNVNNSKLYPNVVLGGVTDPVVVAGTSNNNIYDANFNSGLVFGSANAGFSANGHASGRLRLGDLDENISNTTNGISVKDDAASVAIGLGQSLARSVGLLWVYGATPANAYAALYTFGSSNPLKFQASELSFETDSVPRWKINSSGMLLPVTTDTYDVGNLTTPLRVRAIYPKIVDTALAGGTGDYIQTRKLQLFDNTGSTTGAAFWDLNAVISGAGASQNSYFYLRDNGGTNVFRAERIISGAAVDRTYWYTDVTPDTDLGQNFGDATHRWQTAWINQLGTATEPTTVYGGNSQFTALTITTAPLLIGTTTDGGTGASFMTSATNNATVLDNYSAVGSNIQFRNARGSSASPTATQSADRLGSLTFAGMGSTVRGSPSIRIRAIAEETFTDSTKAAKLCIETTATLASSSTERWCITGAGHLLASSDGAVNIGELSNYRPNNLYLAGAANIGGVLTLASTVSGDVVPTLNNTAVLGTGSFYWNQVRSQDFYVENSGRIRPTTTNTGSVGISTARFNKGWFTDLDITGTITPPSGTAFTGTKTVRASGGASDCTLTFSSGIMTGGTC